jgi:hypothetical protein
VQSSYSVREIAPRIPVGLIASGLSLFLAGKAVDLANALSHALMNQGAGKSAPTLATLVLTNFVPGADLFTDIMWVVVVGVLVALLLTYVVRVALIVILIAGAPLALMCHALPQTDGIARWWWKAFGGVLAIQVAQSLTLITGVRVFLGSGGLAGSLFGGVGNGLVNLLVTLALTYILFKIPFWVLGSLRGSGHRSIPARLARSYVMYQTMGLLRGGNTAASQPTARGGVRPRPTPGSGRGTFTAARRRQSGAPGPGPVRRQALLRTPLFLPPGGPPSTPRPRGPIGHAPPMPVFQAPGQSARRPGVDPVGEQPPRPLSPPGRPQFLSPAAAAPGRPAPARGPRPAPGLPHFQSPNTSAPPAPRRALGPPAPATFRAPAPAAPPPQSPNRPAALPPAPPAFRSPTASSRPAPPPPSRGDRS